MNEAQKIEAAVELLKPVLDKVLNDERKDCDQRLFDRFQDKFSSENIESISEQDFIDFF